MHQLQQSCGQICNSCNRNATDLRMHRPANACKETYARLMHARLLGQVVRGESSCNAVADLLQLLQICCSAWRAHVMRVTRPANARTETCVRVQRPTSAGMSVTGGALGERVAALLQHCCSSVAAVAALLHLLLLCCIAALLQLLQICCSAWSAHAMRVNKKKTHPCMQRALSCVCAKKAINACKSDLIMRE